MESRVLQIWTETLEEEAVDDQVADEEEVVAMPASITAIVKHMDDLEPNARYYTRQQDTRGECSKTRGKLRKFAKANPDHPAIAHWVLTKNWQPPDQVALDHLIALIKTMIK
jgi:chitodextrinase